MSKFGNHWLYFPTRDHAVFQHVYLTRHFIIIIYRRRLHGLFLLLWWSIHIKLPCFHVHSHSGRFRLAKDFAWSVNKLFYRIIKHVIIIYRLWARIGNSVDVTGPAGGRIIVLHPTSTVRKDKDTHRRELWKLCGRWV